MPFDVQSATARLSYQLPSAETAADNAALEIGDVLSTAVMACRDTGVRDAKTHATILRLHRAMGRVLESQAELQRAHAQMLHISVEQGMADEPNCPKPSAEADDAHAGLKLVS